MDTDLLCRWLGLPSGVWPPENRVLLGLPPGPLNAGEVQTRALERMDKLRPHQLRNPELVTEGMNRLAQALIAVERESPAVPAPIHRTTIAPLVTPVKSSADDREIILDADILHPPLARPQPAVVEVDDEIVDAEVVEPAAAARPPISFETYSLAAGEEPTAAPELVSPVIMPLPEGLAFQPAERRQRIAELVRLRRRLRSWQGLRESFAAPSEDLASSFEVAAFLEAVLEFQKDDPRDSTWPVAHGHLVRAVVRQPLTLALFRALVPSQRLALAGDWALAAGELEGLRQGMRRALRAGKPRSKSRRLLLRGRSIHRRNPEFLLFAVLIAAGVLVGLRSLAR